MAGVFTPFFNDGLKAFAGIDIAVLADAEEEDAVDDTLAGIGELVAFEQFGVVVVFVDVGGESAAGFIEKP